MTKRKPKPRRPKGVPIPTLRESRDGEFVGHAALPILSFRDGPSDRRLEWLEWKERGDRVSKMILYVRARRS